MSKHLRCVQFDMFGGVPAPMDPVTVVLPDGPKTIRLAGMMGIRSALRWPELWVYLAEVDMVYYKHLPHFPSVLQEEKHMNLVLVPREAVELVP